MSLNTNSGGNRGGSYGGGSNFRNRPQVVKGMRRRERRNGKESFPRCHVEISGKLYRIEIGPAKKDGVEAWCTVTELGRAERR